MCSIYKRYEFYDKALGLKEVRKGSTGRILCISFLGDGVTVFQLEHTSFAIGQAI
jgi:hypothetical protein